MDSGGCSRVSKFLRTPAHSALVFVRKNFPLSISFVGFIWLRGGVKSWKKQKQSNNNTGGEVSLSFRGDDVFYYWVVSFQVAKNASDIDEWEVRRSIWSGFECFFHFEVVVRLVLYMRCRFVKSDYLHETQTAQGCEIYFDPRWPGVDRARVM